MQENTGEANLSTRLCPRQYNKYSVLFSDLGNGYDMKLVEMKFKDEQFDSLCNKQFISGSLCEEWLQKTKVCIS